MGGVRRWCMASSLLHAQQGATWQIAADSRPVISSTESITHHTSSRLRLYHKRLMMNSSLLWMQLLFLMLLMLQWNLVDAFAIGSSLHSLCSRLKMSTAADPALRIGHGWDIHRLVEGRPLVIGGVTLPHTMGADAHRWFIFWLLLISRFISHLYDCKMVALYM